MDFLGGNAERLVEKHVSTLKGESTRLRGEADLARERYLKSPGGSAEGKFQTEAEMAKRSAAEGMEKDAASAARRFGGKIPIVGLGVTAAGIGYDISTGKPPGKAIVSGLAGAGAAALVGGPVGLGAVAAVGFGIAAGAGADYVWNHWVPDGAKEKINEGVRAVGDGIANVGKSVGNFFSSMF
ncbi:MAG: hypothetical protein ACRDQ5_14890 [Sciscionella sp.]